MKKLITTTLILIAAFATLTVGTVAAADAAICGSPQFATLFAGQTIDAGSVIIANDADNLYVTFSSSEPWLIEATHLHVADELANVPQTKNGNPKIGNFAFQRSYDPLASSDTYILAKSDLVFGADGSLVIAAHAVVVQELPDGSFASETGWGNGPGFDGKSWATYIEYTWQDCDPDPDPETKTETAFAFGGDYATCFLDLGFSRWGWTNGPLTAGSYEFEIYAGAGQCDLDKGTLVGTLTVEYDGSTALVTYHIEAGFSMTETHLYAGSEILAMNNGEPTVAPGQYLEIHGDLDNVSSDSFTISGLSGEIYLVAHAVVDGFPAE